ncbi:UDP-N-acetylmuramate dehydrogenase [Candidatus Shapirobacteria bacterium]|nr:UDP-N-acetylmuramate dehydrogenase [Candidatus Shapirobacteria bacterium]
MDKGERLRWILGQELKENEPMGRHTTFGIGGPADWFWEAKTEEALIRVIRKIREVKVPYFILGNGSNLLVGDKGVRGLVIKVQSSKFKVQNDNSKFKIIAEAGVSLSKLITSAAEHSLSGLEFLVGIPGTLGGAIRGNAGTKDEWIDRAVETVEILDELGERRILNRRDCKFGYRNSRFSKAKEIILGATLLVKREDKLFVQRRIKDYLAKRKNQPAEPSAGSIFKNPKGDFAGRLIEAAGLKGCQIGGAQISEKHANFIVNTGGAKAVDVLALIDLAQKKVKEKFGVELEEEIIRVGEF